MPNNILIADDEESIRFTFKEFLTDAGYNVSTVDTLKACLEQLRQEKYDLLYLDINLGHDNGLDAIKVIKALQPTCKVIMITGAFNSRAIVTARMQGASDYLAKPIRHESLLYITKKELLSKV
ncbi:MAG: hypothetical protein C0624_11265 [Desulfuromonas sp.]|nr:MAG: hypothetical protein C0624_11265 [Desulfuromonas sp.]